MAPARRDQAVSVGEVTRLDSTVLSPSGRHLCTANAQDGMNRIPFTVLRRTWCPKVIEDTLLF